MTTIYLIRHAEAEGNLYRIAQGQANSSITDRGERQIQALARRFADIPIDAVYASDLYRTCATARAVYVPRGMELHTDPDLREINMGRWEDRTWGEVRQTEGERLLQFNHSDPAWVAPGGEGLGDVGARAARHPAHRRKIPRPDRGCVQPRHCYPPVPGQCQGDPAGRVAHHATRGQHLRDLSGLGRRGVPCGI